MGGTRADPKVMSTLYTLSTEAADDPSWERVRARLEWLMADPASVTDDLIRTRQAIFQQPEWKRACEMNMALQEPETRKRNMLTDDDLRAITAPALVVWTTKDPSGPVDEGRRIASLIPGAALAVIPNAGHWPQYEAPETFNQVQLGLPRRHAQGALRQHHHHHPPDRQHGVSRLSRSSGRKSNGIPGPLRPRASIAQLGAINLGTADLDSSLWFFRDVLGMEVVDEADGIAYLRCYQSFVHHSLVLRHQHESIVNTYGLRVRRPQDVELFAEDSVARTSRASRFPPRPSSAAARRSAFCCRAV